ncbi:hypothetical protein LES9216_01456 [Leuconostoc suionicum]|uniref:Uncharacterized protein n=1 Tax=Leuconostoc suionicum TaxID=1511761 RepID=A0A2N9KEQ2_9LACO|nr:hypothetical protein LES8486_01309 [Leuconostoc suionicum]SPE09307.1 hypothetical protein LES9216_01456 [Leuconostoc suionicum]SPH04574.1 hypothetical protein LES8484_01309 [Leuconostoc suionicum]
MFYLIIILFLILTFTLGIGVAFEALILMGIIYVILRLIKNKRDMRK